MNEAKQVTYRQWLIELESVVDSEMTRSLFTECQEDWQNWDDWAQYYRDGLTPKEAFSEAFTGH